jgi:putative RNA 2'-phosphotransferase
VVVDARRSYFVKVSARDLSRLVSHALRHEPSKYGLEVDAEGWVPVDSLLSAIHRQGSDWAGVTRDDVVNMIEQSAKKRHEVDGERIRARYGHSLPGRIDKVEAESPARLFHGTSPDSWISIQRVGLRPMRRQNVHLSSDVADAQAVGRRKSPHPVILEIDTRAAARAGTRFSQGNDTIWLADFVGPDHVSRA